MNLLNVRAMTFMKVEVAVLGSPSLTVLTVSMDVKQHRTQTYSSPPTADPGTTETNSKTPR